MVTQVKKYCPQKQGSAANSGGGGGRVRGRANGRAGGCGRGGGGGRGRSQAGSKRKARQEDGAAKEEADNDETDFFSIETDDKDQPRDHNELQKLRADMKDMMNSMAKVCTPTNPPHEAP